MPFMQWAGCNIKGDRMRKVQKETNQAPETFVWENVIRLSTENNIPVTVKVDDEIITGVAYRLLSTRQSDMLYLKGVKAESSGEFHVCVNLRHVKMMAFDTPEGMLDDIWNIV